MEEIESGLRIEIILDITLEIKVSLPRFVWYYKLFEWKSESFPFPSASSELCGRCYQSVEQRSSLMLYCVSWVKVNNDLLTDCFSRLLDAWLILVQHTHITNTLEIHSDKNLQYIYINYLSLSPTHPQTHTTPASLGHWVWCGPLQ